MKLRAFGRRVLNAARHPLAPFAPKDPVTVFHHLPKCGGASILQVLGHWFVRVEEYRETWSSSHPPKTDLRSLRSSHCLCGHFELPGAYLHERYPEVLGSPRFRIFTFLREPLQVRLSLDRYEHVHGRRGEGSLEDRLLARPNYLAGILPATRENYREVLDRYFFIGILEEGQAAVDALAAALGRRSRPLPRLNRTFGSADVSPALVERFRSLNELDYLIYAHAVERYRNRPAG